ncbi:hypothetical protein FN846DRAFT_38579 [Sphaerosporella brunnea]|uniref:Uncharacterized protein n=1 Tax=Sphaerosporella brunnea TaxID=1250544 RepID=A0A5J5FA43_9PEZI|nr:hypothetical protein FN846DRAFT_38579 [Sphaerosporella brunnea]
MPDVLVPSRPTFCPHFQLPHPVSSHTLSHAGLSPPARDMHPFLHLTAASTESMGKVALWDSGISNLTAARAVSTLSRAKIINLLPSGGTSRSWLEYFYSNKRPSSQNRAEFTGREASPSGFLQGTFSPVLKYDDFGLKLEKNRVGSFYRDMQLPKGSQEELLFGWMGFPSLRAWGLSFGPRYKLRGHLHLPAINLFHRRIRTV